MQEIPASTERETVLTLAATDAGATESVDITLTQEALRFSAENTALNVEGRAGKRHAQCERQCALAAFGNDGLDYHCWLQRGHR